MPKTANADDEVGLMDEKTFKAFLKKLDLAQADVEDKADEAKTARSVLSGLWKEFKKAGGKPDTMRAVMALRRMEEGDLVQYEEDRQRYAQWMKLPIGAQAKLFDDDETGDDAPAPAAAAPLTERGKRGARGPKLVEPPNVTGSPLN